MRVYQQWRFLQLQQRPRPSRTDETKNALVQSFSCSSFHLSLRQRCRQCHSDQSGPRTFHTTNQVALCCCIRTLVSAEAPCTGVGSYKAPGDEGPRQWWWQGRQRTWGSWSWYSRNRIYPLNTFEYHGHVTILAFGAILPRNTASHKMGSHMWLAAHPVEMLYTWSRVKRSCALDSRHL